MSDELPANGLRVPDAQLVLWQRSIIEGMHHVVWEDRRGRRGQPNVKLFKNLYGVVDAAEYRMLAEKLRTCVFGKALTHIDEFIGCFTRVKHVEHDCFRAQSPQGCP